MTGNFCLPDGILTPKKKRILRFEGGYTVVNSGGDGLDSNGNIEQSGGRVVVFGPSDNGNGAIDYGDGKENAFTFTGGELLAVGSSGMMQTVTSDLQSVAVRMNNLSAKTNVYLLDEKGNCLVAFQTPKSISSIVFASAGLSVQSVSVYTGGTRLKDGSCEANTNMPASVFSTYSLAQSPIVPNDIADQGAVYGSFAANKVLKKGERVSFTVSWDAQSKPRSLHLTVAPGNAVEVFKRLRTEAEKGEVDALVGFSDDLTVAEATAAANALATIDSARVKINGCTNIFYRSFLPLVKWLDRQERLVQPFELTLGDPDQLVFIEEDWSGEGEDPKLTPKTIPFAEAVKYPRTDTCFIFTTAETRLSRIRDAMSKLGEAKVRNWYVFTR